MKGEKTLAGERGDNIERGESFTIILKMTRNVVKRGVKTYRTELAEKKGGGGWKKSHGQEMRSVPAKRKGGEIPILC